MDKRLNKTQDPTRRADRYQKVAGDYYDLAKNAPSPYLRDYFQHTAEEYRALAQGQLKVLEREGAR